MLVKTWMSSPVITVNVSDSMQDAIKLLKRYHINILPVLKNGDLAGIITDRDLKKPRLLMTPLWISTRSCI